MKTLRALGAMAFVLLVVNTFGCARWAGPNNTLAPIHRSGAVGIGTAMPGATLDVRGDITLGSDGKSYATSGGENLRMVRGVVRKDGAIFRGEGFSVNKIGVGHYQVIFEPAFGGYPSAVASIDNPEPPSGMIRVIHWNLNNRIDIITMSKMDAGGVSGIPEDRGFSFIAVGPRE